MHADLVTSYYYHRSHSVVWSLSALRPQNLPEAV